MNVLITGGAKGIGKACVEHFLDQGYKVIALDNDGEALAKLNRDNRLTTLTCDVTKEENVKYCVNEAVSNYGDIDVLVNNAGVQHYGSVHKTSSDEWDFVIGVNLKAPFLMSKYCIPSMLNANKGVIINVSSVQAFLCQKRVAAYTSSKSGLLGLTRSIAVDYAPTIRCVAVCPGTVRTPMLEKAINESANPELALQEINNMHLTNRAAEPMEVAQFIGYLASEKASFMTGCEYRIDGGIGIEIGGN